VDEGQPGPAVFLSSAGSPVSFGFLQMRGEHTAEREASKGEISLSFLGGEKVA
jgi:hypothetical protein